LLEAVVLRIALKTGGLTSAAGLAMPALALILLLAATLTALAKITTVLPLSIAAFIVNLPALMIFSALDTMLFVTVDPTIGTRAPLHSLGARLAVFQACRFAISQLSAAQALLNPFLLGEVAVDFGLHALRRRRVWIAAFVVLAFARNILADAVLRTIDLRAFGVAESAITQRAGLQAVDARLFAFKARGFAYGQIARPQALLNPALLLDIAIGKTIIGDDDVVRIATVNAIAIRVAADTCIGGAIHAVVGVGSRAATPAVGVLCLCGGGESGEGGGDQYFARQIHDVSPVESGKTGWLRPHAAIVGEIKRCCVSAVHAQDVSNGKYL
jgi:hypothetical protein